MITFISTTAHDNGKYINEAQCYFICSEKNDHRDALFVSILYPVIAKIILKIITKKKQKKDNIDTEVSTL